MEIRITENFETNLDANTFAALLDALFETIIPNLQRHPRMGVDFLSRLPASMEGETLWRQLRDRVAETTELREYIHGDYLLLYALTHDTAYLLSIKHHRQLAYELGGVWP
jgi:hypothetical protein